MNQSTTKIYSLGYAEMRAWLTAAVFVVGNLLLPQLCHLIPQGGLILLPIYFFTLIAAYKFGPFVGVLTAVASPLLNSALFGMPVPALLPVILIKSVVLALAASFIASRTQKVSLLSVTLAVAAYQIIGSLAEWAITGSLAAALQDVRMGWPGILLQIFGGWAVLRFANEKW